jgi:hypothetical protein
MPVVLPMNEFWASVGRAAKDNPELPFEFVVQALASTKEPLSDATPFQPRHRA